MSFNSKKKKKKVDASTLRRPGEAPTAGWPSRCAQRGLSLWQSVWPPPVSLVSSLELENAQQSRKNNKHRLLVTSKGTCVPNSSPRTKLTYTTNKSTSHRQREKITYARWQLKSSGENTIFMIPGSLPHMYELLATTSVSDLRPRVTAAWKPGLPRTGCSLRVLFNRKNPNQSVNIIIYLSLQRWWKNVQMSSFNKV